MSAPFYIALDVETGGLEAEDSLLTAFFLILDEEFKELSQIYLRIKPNAGKSYVVHPSAMEVNQIDLREHDKIAIPVMAASNELHRFIKDWSMNGQIKLVPIGHGVLGDLYCIWDKLIKRRTFEQFTSFRKLDTAVITQFLQTCGILPKDISGSLDSLVKHFKLESVRNSHDAADDTRATVAVLKELIKLENGIPQINSSPQ